jgi:hypothetical protein
MALGHRHRPALLFTCTCRIHGEHFPFMRVIFRQPDEARRGGEAIKSPKAHAKLAVNMIAQQNQVVITHLGEPCVFDIDRCELSITEDGLDLDVFTNPNRNCPLGHLSAPTIHIESATVNAKTIEELTKEELNVPVGWDTDDDPKADNIFPHLYQSTRSLEQQPG